MRRFVALGVLGFASVFIAAAQGVPQASGDYVVVLKAGAERAAVAGQARSLGGEVRMEYSHALNGFAVRLPANAAAQLRSAPNVQFVTVDAEFSYAQQTLSTGVDRIDGELSTTSSGNGSGSVNVNIAILDSGIDSEHPDLNVVGGTDCVSSGKRSTIEDAVGHGTAVAGAAAALDNSDGGVGVAPGARLFAVRVGAKAPKLSAIVCGVDWVTGTRLDSDPTNDIAVANMSFGAKGSDDANCGLSSKDALHLAICHSVEKGVVYVAGAGNEAADLATSIPANYDEVLSATAISDYDGQPGGLAQPTCAAFGTDDGPAAFSNFATLPQDQAHTLSTPGTCSLTTALGGGYRLFSGTSLASPLAAGATALCIASGGCAGLTPRQVVQKVIADAAAYNQANPGYGFQGDPLRPISGKYYGYLIRAGLY